MKNKKGFTLVELLAVIVIITILVLLVIPNVTRYVMNSRKSAFVEDAKTIVSIVRSNYGTGSYDAINGIDESKRNRVIYSKEAIDSILVNKLGKSPFGTNYKYAEALIHKIIDKDGVVSYEYYVCLIDEEGHGFDNQNEKDLSTANLDMNKTYTGCKALPPDDHEVEVKVVNGNVSGDNIKQVSDGGYTSFNIIPDQDTKFKEVKCTNHQNYTISLASNTLTVNSVINDTVCTVVYELIPKYNVEVKVVNGNVSGDSIKQVLEGGNANFTVNPNTGMKFKNVTCTNGQNGTMSSNTLNVTNVKSNTVCTVNYEPIVYTVQVEVNNGTVDISSKQVQEGKNTSFAISPNTGTDPTSATVSCTNGQNGTMSSNTLNVTNVTNNTKCTVNYKKAYKVDVNGVNVKSISPSTKTVREGTNATFTLTPSEGVNTSIPATVTCTNNQNGTVSSNTLNVTNVTNNTVCTVTYTLKTYTITYKKGTETSATNVPLSQTKSYGQTITISSQIPTSNANDFIGWQKENTSTWYDEGSNYSNNSNLTLNAQWYDIKSLEKKYTNTVQTGDFHSEKVTKTITLSTGQSKVETFTPPTVDGYSMWYRSEWTMDDRLRAWSNGESKIGYLAMIDVTEKPISATWLYVKNRSEKTYENDKPDERIDRLQKLQDLSLVYIDGDEVNPADEIIEQGYNFGRRVDGDSPVEITGGNNISLPKEGVVEDHAKSRDPEDLKSNWHRLGSLGFFMTGYEDNNSLYPNVYKLSATSLHDGRIRIKNGSALDTIQTIAQSRWLYVKNKTARTTTYQPTSPYGASRLEALNELKNVKDHYFDRSQLKTGCVENNINNPMQIGNWDDGMPTEDSNIFMKFVRISGGTGKLLGTYAYEIAPATNTTNHIYANVYANYLARTGASETTEKRKQTRLSIKGGNESWASENGHSASLSTVRSCFCYIGTGEATVE